MMKLKKYLLMIYFITVVPMAASGQTFTVTTLSELQSALTSAASNGEDDTINISAGTYTLTSLLSYDSNEDKSLTLQGSGGPVLDGNGGTQILYLRTYTANASVLLRGMVFKKGFISEDATKIGSELFVRTQSANITLEDVEFRDGRASSLFSSQNGGALYLRIESGGAIRVQESFFSGNYSKGVGGGAYVMGGSGTSITLLNNVFSSNEASTQGGGFCISLTDGTATLVNNTLTSNITGSGNGGGGGYLRLYNDSATANIYNNIFWGNTADNGIGADLYVEDDGDSNGAGATVKIYNNDYSDLDRGNGGNFATGGNINQNPLLTSDFHILGDSPCKDAGNASAPLLPASDFEGHGRTMGSAPDMGADEYYISIPALSSWGLFLLLSLLLGASLTRLRASK